jgi:hypothetical protein
LKKIIDIPFDPSLNKNGPRFFYHQRGVDEVTLKKVDMKVQTSVFFKGVGKGF